MIVLTSIVFALTYIVICNWFQLISFVTAIAKPKRIRFISDVEISNIIYKKTGLTLSRITIFESNSMFGMMPAIPWKPEMILSSSLYSTLNRDELEWVILHEAAHCLLWHTVKSALVQLLMLSIGVFVIMRIFPNLLIIFPLSISLAVITIQIMRKFEREADTFAIAHVKNPQAVITAQQQFENKRPTKYAWIYAESGIIRSLFFWNILPSERIRLASMRISLNTKNP